MPLAELKVEIAAGSADAVEAALLEQGSDAWSLREDAIACRAWLVGIFSGREEADRAWDRMSRVAAVVPLAPPEFRTLADKDWRDSYKAHFHAWRFGRLHWVPVWEKPAFRLPPGHAVLWLDPGLAFGTGNHETTRLCCERLVAWARQASDLRGKIKAGRSARVIDAGCGSGILALSAARLGLGPIVAFDLDPEAVRVSRENARSNGLGRKVKFYAADLAGGLAGRKADIVLANIQADVLGGNTAVLAGAVAPGGALVLSGILARELDAVRAAFAPAVSGWRSRSRTLGEWSDLMFTAPAPSARLPAGRRLPRSAVRSRC